MTKETTPTVDQGRPYSPETSRPTRELRRQAREQVRRARHEARALRARARATLGVAPRPKDRTLHVRLSGPAFAAVEQSAEQHGRSVSDELRALIADHYGVPPNLPPILGWQPFTLSDDASCEGCGQRHPAGGPMFVAIERGAHGRLLVCAACKARCEPGSASPAAAPADDAPSAPVG